MSTEATGIFSKVTSVFYSGPLQCPEIPRLRCTPVWRELGSTRVGTSASAGSVPRSAQPQPFPSLEVRQLCKAASCRPRLVLGFSHPVPRCPPRRALAQVLGGYKPRQLRRGG